MQLKRVFAALAALATTALLFAAPASAQATRTWVSGVGDDANPCSRTAPCKTFAGAISKTATSGEIDCLDPGGFGALTITKSITINCTAPGGIGGVLVSGTNGFVVAGGTQVQLIGLDFNGLTTGLNGVLVNGAGVSVTIDHCLFFGFNSAGSTTGAGVSVTAASAVYIENSTIENNNAGVVVAPSTGNATVRLDHVVLNNNFTSAVTVPAALSGNLIVATNGKALLNASSLTASAAIKNAGTVDSYGNNVINGAITGTAIVPVALQ